MTPLPENEVEKEVLEKGLLDIDDFVINEPDDDIPIKEPDDEHKKNGRIRKQASPHIAVLLYPDNIDHERAYNIICRKFDFTMISHDKDMFESEEDEMQKKVHRHVLLHFASQRTPAQISRILMIEERFVQCVTNRDSFLRYMIHLDDKDKFQYDPKEVVSNRPQLFLNALKRAKEKSERFTEIIDYIVQNKNKLSYTAMIRRLVCSGYYELVSKNQSLIYNIYYD